MAASYSPAEEIDSNSSSDEDEPCVNNVPKPDARPSASTPENHLVDGRFHGNIDDLGNSLRVLEIKDDIGLYRPRGKPTSQFPVQTTNRPYTNQRVLGQHALRIGGVQAVFGQPVYVIQGSTQQVVIGSNVPAQQNWPGYAASSLAERCESFSPNQYTTGQLSPAWSHTTSGYESSPASVQLRHEIIANDSNQLPPSPPLDYTNTQNLQPGSSVPLEYTTNPTTSSTQLPAFNAIFVNSADGSHVPYFQPTPSPTISNSLSVSTTEDRSAIVHRRLEFASKSNEELMQVNLLELAKNWPTLQAYLGTVFCRGMLSDIQHKLNEALWNMDCSKTQHIRSLLRFGASLLGTDSSGNNWLHHIMSQCHNEYIWNTILSICREEQPEHTQTAQKQYNKAGQLPEYQRHRKPLQFN